MQTPGAMRSIGSPSVSLPKSEKSANVSYWSVRQASDGHGAVGL